jgi:DNA-binding LytR/AlgR family response regulator
VEAQHLEREALTRMPARALIAEDEATLADELRDRLLGMWPGLEICGVAGDGVEAMRLIDLHRPEVVFLDIEMPSANGLEVARHASGRCHVVFVTAFDHYAVDAFEEGAIDYVRKPVTAARLYTTVTRLQARMADPPPDLTPLLLSIAERARLERTYLRWINASRGADICLITIDEVLYFKAEDKYTVVCTATGEALVRRPIKDLVIDLDPKIFLQIHRSTVVNANAIASVRRNFRGHLEVRLKGRTEVLAVAESYNRVFKQM